MFNINYTRQLEESGCPQCGSENLLLLEGDDATFDHVGNVADLQIRRGYKCQDCGEKTMMVPPGRDGDRPSRR